jgi:hypothetical protein
MAKKKETVHPSKRLLQSGCYWIDIKKISNHSVLLPGDDQMDRYKITYFKKTYQLMKDGDNLILVLVKK